MKPRRTRKMKGGYVKKIVPQTAVRASTRATTRATRATSQQATSQQATTTPVLTVSNIQPILDAYNTLNTDVPKIAPNGLFGLLGPLQPLMAKIQQSITNNNGVTYANGLALTQADITPVVDLYNTLTPGLKELVPKIIPPLLAPIFKVILPQAGFP